MINLQNNCTVSNLVIDANREARTCISAYARNGITITDCILFDTKNDYNTPGSFHHPSLINVDRASSVVIRNCQITNAGCNPMLNPGSWESLAKGIWATLTTHVEISNCHIDNTLGSSIGILGAQDVNIFNNRLDHSGQIGAEKDRLGVPRSYGEDAINGYHNTGYANRAMRNILIANNIITNYENHGMHLSGENIQVVGNTIHTGYASAICICDAGWGGGINEETKNSYILWNNVENG